jgi:erythromycin esterase
MIEARNVTASNMRDQAMAENAGWVRDQAGPNGRIVLWAHNGHINSVPEYMGGYLRARYGADYVNVGFLFGEGSFNAVGLSGEGLKQWRTTLIPSNSIEAIFAGTNKSALMFNTHLIPSGGAPSTPLAGPIPMRSIGSAFGAGADASFFGPVTFPSTFDVLIYLQATTATTLLPFIGQ